MSIVVLEQPAAGEFEDDRIGKSSKWDHHITLAVVVTILSVFAFNFLGLFCGVAGIYFAFKVMIICLKLGFLVQRVHSAKLSVHYSYILYRLVWHHEMKHTEKK